ncbi:MAG: hypothetical protein Q7J54_04600 [Candidatus Woesearchaeota archaeon]|nr:hypothetical protein [Candidatus Woesearchaeota archaeon]
MDPLLEIQNAIEQVQNADVERILMHYVDKSETDKKENKESREKEAEDSKINIKFKMPKIKPIKTPNPEYSYIIEKEKNKDKPKAVYYYSPKIIKPAEAYYTFIPSGVTIRRAPQAHLGFGVLGRAFPGLNVIEILETLYGSDFEEVKFHEVKHVQYPHLSEIEIRQKVKSELPFEARYH